MVPEFVKSRDLTALETIYLYHIVEWFGPFARFAFSTSTFAGSDLRAAPTTYSILRRSGAVDTLVAQRLRLTESLRPTRLKESVGVFFQPVARESITAEFRVGGGGRNTFAAEQLAIKEDTATPAVDVVELTDVHQLGVEAVAELFGAALSKGLTYKLVAEVLLPLWFTPDLPAGDDRGVIDLINVSIKGTLSVHVVEWASLDYELGIDREPLLLDAWQIRNNLLVTFGIAAGNVEPPAPKKE